MKVMEIQRIAGQPCPVCKRIVVHNEPPGLEPFDSCSTYCEIESDRNIQEFLQAKKGDYCVYPCPECGESVDDVWDPDDPKGCVCSDCGPKIRVRTCLELLKEARDYLNDLPGDPAEGLIARIDEALREIKKDR